MSDDIFNAFTVVEAVWPEIERLLAAIPAAFQPEFAAIETGRESGETDSAEARMACHFSLRRLSPRVRSYAQLMLLFDLSRPAMPSSWPHARQALLTCAYSPSLADPWTLPQASLGMDGNLAALEFETPPSLYCDDRLLAWRDDDDWTRSPWLFSVPLLSIDSHAALLEHIVEPVKRLLSSARGEAAPLDALTAVRFASP